MGCPEIISIIFTTVAVWATGYLQGRAHEAIRGKRKSGRKKQFLRCFPTTTMMP